MQTRTLGSIQRQRGYTLMEILVAVAIFATVMIVALLLYDQSNRVFKKANESAEMQQNTRVAFEKVVADLRMAGFDYKRAGTPKAGVPTAWVKETNYSLGTLIIPTPPNGHVYRASIQGKSAATAPTWTTGTGDLINDGTMQWQEAGAPVYEQPDEQIEFAHDKAITIRANYDYDDPGASDHGREPELEVSSGGSFPIVTTGNDEIVTYALVSKSGNSSANQDKITFFADVQMKDGKPARRGFPGGLAEKEITITGVDLTNKYPPYTLMRYTLNANGEPVGTALADNIRSMTFRYWQDYSAKEALRDITDTAITDFATLGGTGKFDPATPNAAIPGRIVRGKVRAVTATIVGMNPQPDYDYTSPTDTVMANYRQYELQSTIVGRNLGLKGIPQSETDPPGPPTITNSCTGYCGVVFLTWNPAPNTGLVTYTVLYDTSAGGSFQGVMPAGSQTSLAVDLTQFDLTKTYYFRVAATNEAGTTVSEGSPLALDLRNKTKPKPPKIDKVTAEKNALVVTFTPDKSGNAAGTPSCSTGAPVSQTFPAEVRGYRIYRSKESGFDPADYDPSDPAIKLVLDENMPGLTSNGAGSFDFVDTTVANCTKYYYRVATVEWCEQQAGYNNPADTANAMSDFSDESAVAEAAASAKAKTPLNFKQDVTAVCDPIANRCDPVKMNWEAVVKDVEETTINVERYDITRTTRINGVPQTGEIDVPLGAVEGTVTDGTTTYTDTDKLMHHVEGDESQVYTYEYKLVAWNCEDQKSDPATLVYPGSCVTGATIVADADGPGAGTADSPMENVRALSVIEHATKPITQVEAAVDGGGWTTLDAPYGMDWDIQDGEVHRVAFRIVAGKSPDDCTEILMFYIQADPADCAIRTAVSSINGNTLQTRVVLANISDEDVLLDTVDIAWSGQAGQTWLSVRFPSGQTFPATFTLPQTQGSPRTVTFTPAAQEDREIKSGESITLIMNFAGTGTSRPSQVGGVSSDYHEVSIATQFGCSSQLEACAISATTSATADTDIINIDIRNNDTEPMTLTGLTITWTGQTNWQWASLTAGTTFSFTPISSGTKTFAVSGVTIGAGDTFRATMKMTTSANNPPNLVANNVTTVWADYVTPTSVHGVLTCRAK